MNEAVFGNSFAVAETAFGRWILLHPDNLDLAWTGSQWAPHVNGIGTEAQISNFESWEEANRYGETFWEVGGKS
jgi:hypothetical protein